MTPRLLLTAFIFILSVAPVMSSTVAPAKAKKTPPTATKSKTWKMTAEYVFKNGSDRPFHGSRAVKLGYETNTVAAKAMRLKSNISPDKRERALFVVYEKDAPKEIIVAETLVTEKPDGKYVEGFDFRVDMSGKLISALNGTGIAGAATITPMDVKSARVKRAFKSTTEFVLKSLSLDELTK